MRYAARVVLTTLVIVAAIALFGARPAPAEPHLDATHDLVLGLVLVNVAVLMLYEERLTRPGCTARSRSRRFWPRSEAPF